MDLFQGVAENYTKYREGYPPEAIEIIKTKLGLNGLGRLLDVGCGDGRLTLSLAPYFKEITAVDISSEMIDKAREYAKSQGIENIIWLVKNADDLDESIGRFDCVSFGQSLHWLNIEKALNLIHGILLPGGSVMILQMKSIWNYAPAQWEQKTLEVIKKYLGPERRTVNGLFQISKKPYEEYLRENGFSRLEKIEYNWPKTTQTVDDVIEKQFTYSYATKSLFGDKIEEFKEELKEELLKICPDNQFIAECKGSIIFAFRD